jgi:hypothetical protein
MDNYCLESNEVVLYKGNGIIKSNSKSEGLLTNITHKEIMLTNINIVGTLKTKKMFAKEEVEITVFPVADIKIYNGVPQIKQDNYKVEIYLVDSEIILEFYSKSEVRKFINAVYEFITGKSISERGASKVKGAVNMVDDTLGIDSVGTIKSVVENGVVGSVFGGLGKTGKKKGKNATVVSDILSFAKGSLSEKTSEEESQKIEGSTEVSFEDQIESLKKLKELLDASIITQEEFDAKKKQIMGI